MAILVAILAAVVAVSLISLVGVVFIGIRESFLRRILTALIGFASGSLIGGALIHLLPEAAEELGHSAFDLAIMGIIFFFFMEKFLYWRHCHEGKCPVHVFVYLNLIGDGIHNFIDGMIIAASFIFSYDLGIITTLAVILHEIPQEIGDFSVLIYGGMRRGKALAYNFLSALTAIAGSLTTYYLTSFIQGLSQFLVPFTAGGFIYIAATDLMPELHKRYLPKDSLVQLLTILTGIGIMMVLKSLIA